LSRELDVIDERCCLAFQIAFVSVTSRLQATDHACSTKLLITVRLHCAKSLERYRAVDEGHIEQELTHVPASGERVVVRRTFMRAA